MIPCGFVNLWVPRKPLPFLTGTHTHSHGFNPQRVRVWVTQNFPVGDPCSSLHTSTIVGNKVDCILFVTFVKEEPKRCQGVHFCERIEKKAGQQRSGNILAISKVKLHQGFHKAFAKTSIF